MLGKSCVVLFLCLYLKYALGEIEYPSVFTSWKSEIEKNFTDKLELETNKLKEKIEQRLEHNSKNREIKDKFFTDKLSLNLNKFKEEFGERHCQINKNITLEFNQLKKKVEELEQNSENKLIEKFTKNFKELEDKLEKKVGERLERNSEIKLEEKLAKKLKELEDKLEKKVGESLERNSEIKLEEKLAKKLKEQEDKFEKNIGERLEQNSKIKLVEKIPMKLKEIEVKLEKKQTVEWVAIPAKSAYLLSDRAVVGGYDSDGSPLWVIRATIKNDLVSGKFIANRQSAFVSYGFKEYEVKDNIEVYCAPPEKVRWVESSNGVVPLNAVVAGKTSDGDKLYVGRAKEKGLWVPGKVHPRYEGAYIPYFGKEVKHNTYEVLCLASV